MFLIRCSTARPTAQEQFKLFAKIVLLFQTPHLLECFFFRNPFSITTFSALTKSKTIKNRELVLNFAVYRFLAL